MLAVFAVPDSLKVAPIPSSRGEKTLPTPGACSVCSVQDEALPSIADASYAGGSLVLVKAPCTWGIVGVPLCGFLSTRDCYCPAQPLAAPALPIASSAYAPHPPSRQRSRMPMRSPPFFVSTQNLLALFNPALFFHRFFHTLFCIQDGRIVSAFGSPGYPSALQKFRGHPVLLGYVFLVKSLFFDVYLSSPLACALMAHML